MMEDIYTKDLKVNWHPCAQMKDHVFNRPLIVHKAQGAYIKLSDGREIIDAISSWWCKSLGHGHPHLKAALQKQLDYFEHVIYANTTYETIIKLSQKLTGLTESLKKVFYASDGASAVEIAMKMSLHSRQITGETNRHKFIALANSYHGETAGALSVSDMGIFRQPYKSILFDVEFIRDIPYLQNKSAPKWQNCGDDIWQIVEQQLNQVAENSTALIVEPIVQGVGNMKIYSQDFLCRLSRWCKKNTVHLIADEIMTGIGRTGLSLACKHANIEPDFICLGKGLTSGVLPLSAVLTTNNIYDLFYDDYETGKTFMHSHAHSGNALAASVALACLEIMETENINMRVQNNENFMRDLMLEIAENTEKLTNIRHIGAVIAADLINTNNISRAGYAVAQKAIEFGALLRPLGNTIYWLPPLNIERENLIKLQEITEQAIRSVLCP